MPKSRKIKLRFKAFRAWSAVFSHRKLYVEIGLRLNALHLSSYTQNSSRKAEVDKQGHSVGYGGN